MYCHYEKREKASAHYEECKHKHIFNTNPHSDFLTTHSLSWHQGKIMLQTHFILFKSISEVKQNTKKYIVNLLFC